MPIQNTRVQLREVAERLKKDLDEAGIKTYDVFWDGECWVVPHKPVGKEQNDLATQIIDRHIWR